MTYKKDRTNYVVNNNKLNYKLNEYDIVNYTSETFDIFKKSCWIKQQKNKIKLHRFKHNLNHEKIKHN